MSTTPLREVLKKNVDPRAIDAGWERIRARREKPRGLRAFVVAVPALALAAVLFFVVKTFFFASPAGPQPIALASGAPLPEEWSAPMPKVVALDDGSLLEIDANTKLHPTSKKVDPARVELTLESGATTFDVKPNGPRMWVIDANGVIVRVLGTRFRVERNTNGVDVKVERGKVSVEGAGVEGGAKLLLPGDAIHVDPSKPHAVTPSPINANPPPTGAPANRVVDQNSWLFDRGSSLGSAAPTATTTSLAQRQGAPVPAKENASPSAGQAPRSIARGGDTPPSAAPSTASRAAPASSDRAATNTATNAADESKPSAPERKSEPAPERKSEPAPVPAPVDPMASADAARRAGRSREAVSILSALVDKKDGRSSLAAFTIGKIHAEDLGDHATAAIWFERAIAFGLPRGLDEEAYARAVESHARAGRRVDAARAAARYETTFPNGRHLERVRGFVRN